MTRFAPYMLVMLIMAAMAVLLRPPAPIAAEAHPMQPVAAVTSPREAFGRDVLLSLGNRYPTAEIVAFMVDWSVAEDAGDGAIARNNLYNTTLCLPGRMTGAINGDGACGVQGYATWQDGIEATARTLEQQNFAALRAALLANDADAAKRELWAAPWAASHYGHGAAWPQGGGQ